MALELSNLSLMMLTFEHLDQSHQTVIGLDPPQLYRNWAWKGIRGIKQRGGAAVQCRAVV